MKDKHAAWIFFAVVSAVILLAAYEVLLIAPKAPQENLRQVYYANFSADKSVYHSNEYMNLTLIVISQGYSGEAATSFKGIYARGRNLLDLNQTFDIGKRLNMINVMFKTPQCNTCAGVKAGNYSINALVRWNSTLIANQTMDVEIRQ